MGNLTTELELVTNATDCIIDYRIYQLNDDVGTRFVHDVDPAGDAGADVRNTTIQWEVNSARVVCDVCTLDNNLNNQYVKHLLEGKGLPITYTTYITQGQSVANMTDINIPVILSVSKLVALFITFLSQESQALDLNIVIKSSVDFIIQCKHLTKQLMEFIVKIFFSLKRS